MDIKDYEIEDLEEECEIEEGETVDTDMEDEGERFLRKGKYIAW